jgi:hypothetical protein
MTTIVYRDGVLAFDTLMSQGEMKTPNPCPKAWKTEDGRLLAVTGDYAEGCDFARILAETKHPWPLPTIKNDSTRVVEIYSRTKARIYEQHGYFRLTIRTFAAWGSGAAAAYGALYMGADAREAVAIAMKVDGWSGGSVRSLSL